MGRRVARPGRRVGHRTGQCRGPGNHRGGTSIISSRSRPNLWPSPTSATTSPVESKGRSVSAPSWNTRSGPEGKGGWKRSPCLGRCEQAPAALILNAGESPGANSLAPATTAGIVAARASKEASHDGFESLAQSVPQFGDKTLRLLGRIGRIDPEHLDAYRGSGGYAALARAIDIGPEGVIREVLASKLMGAAVRPSRRAASGRPWRKRRPDPTTWFATPTSRSPVPSRIAS